MPGERSACANLREIEPLTSGSGLSIGIALSRFNRDIGDGLLSGCCLGLSELGVSSAELVTVPGALELPLALKWQAETGRFDALIALGCVIRGETYHFEVVANESARGILDVQLATGVPIANAVLTVDSEEQAQVRMVQKGREAAHCAVEMANLRARIKRPA
ncbi:MAG: 6,7-dimethyl-8-ribityllumazine synthase [Rhodocyclaceae bacterium]|nr:6,7-dimethyl-8-ribityllumazine synthase [Rhodocyclaceae bacterium]